MLRWVLFSPTKWLTSNNPVVCSRFYAPEILWSRYGWTEGEWQRERAKEKYGMRSMNRSHRWTAFNSINAVGIFLLSIFSKNFFLFFLFLSRRIQMIWWADFCVEPTQRKLAPYKSVMIIECCRCFSILYENIRCLPGNVALQDLLPIYTYIFY